MATHTQTPRLTLQEWTERPRIFTALMLGTFFIGLLLGITEQTSLYRFIWKSLYFSTGLLALHAFWIGDVQTASAIFIYKITIDLLSVYMRISTVGILNEIYNSLLAIALGVLTLSRYSGRQKHLPTGLIFALSAFIYLELLGVFLSTDFDYAMIYILVYTGVFMASHYFRAAIRTEAEFFFALRWVVLGCLTIAGYATLGITEEVIWTLGSNPEAVAGLAPNRVSYVLAIGSLICFALFFYEKRFSQRLVLSGTAVYFVYTIFRSFSRGGIYIVLAGILGFWVFSRFKVQYLIGMLVLLGAFYAVFLQMNTETDNVLMQRLQNFESSRIYIWQAGYEIGMEHFYVGVGTSNFDLAIIDHLGYRIHAHNEFVRAFAEHGIVGFSLLVAWFLMTFLYLTRIPQPLIKGTLFALLLAVLGNLLFAGYRYDTAHYVLSLVIGATAFFNAPPSKTRTSTSVNTAYSSPIRTYEETPYFRHHVRL